MKSLVKIVLLISLFNTSFSDDTSRKDIRDKNLAVSTANSLAANNESERNALYANLHLSIINATNINKKPFVNYDVNHIDNRSNGVNENEKGAQL
jgi:hypothetical protein